MKTTIGNESSRNLSSHSVGNADVEIWLWGPQRNSYGHTLYGVNEGRYGCAYSVHEFQTRKQAAAKVRQLRRERSTWLITKELVQTAIRAAAHGAAERAPGGPGAACG